MKMKSGLCNRGVIRKAKRVGTNKKPEKMKKVFALMTVVIFASFLLTSCGGDKDKKDGDKDKKETASNDSDSDDAEEMDNDDAKTGNCEEVLDKYEEFATNFEILQKKSKANPNDLSMLEESGKMFKDLGEWQVKLGDCMQNPAYTDRYTKISERINKAAAIK